MNQRAAFRSLLKNQDIVVLPGAYDVITARLIERAGYPAVYMTGAGTAAISGYPDYGLATMSEMVQNASRITNAVAEGLNSKIATVQKRACGYSNPNNFKIADHFHCGGLNLYPATVIHTKVG